MTKLVLRFLVSPFPYFSSPVSPFSYFPISMFIFFFPVSRFPRFFISPFISFALSSFPRLSVSSRPHFPHFSASLFIVPCFPDFPVFRFSVNQFVIPVLLTLPIYHNNALPTLYVSLSISRSLPLALSLNLLMQKLDSCIDHFAGLAVSILDVPLFFFNFVGFIPGGGAAGHFLDIRIESSHRLFPVVQLAL